MEHLLSLRVFCRVAASGSFSQTARELGLTQSAVSKGVAGLEERLGTRLLERSTRRVTLTAEGRRFRDELEPHLHGIEDAEAFARSGFGEVAGRVRLAAPAALGRKLLLPEIARLLGAVPGLVVETSFTDRRIDLLAGEYDGAFRVGRSTEAAWVERPIGLSEQWLVVAPRLLTTRGTPSDWSALRDFPAVLSGTPGRFAEIGLDVRLVTDDLEGALSGALDGVGLSALPRWLVRPFVERGELVRLLPESEIGGAPVVVLHPRRPRKVARFVLDALSLRLGTALLDGARSG